MKDNKTVIDFKKIDWTKIDREKAVFFYNQAVEYNNALIANISGLNSKAFSLPAMALPLLPAVREKGGEYRAHYNLSLRRFQLYRNACAPAPGRLPQTRLFERGNPSPVLYG